MRHRALTISWLTALGVAIVITMAAHVTAAPKQQGCNQDPYPAEGRGANHSGPYDDTCDGSPSGNGSGNGEAKGKPCAGCVGKADEKNPQGQYPNGGDRNAGYECDRNRGVGRTNPAHTGCRGAAAPPPSGPPPTRRPPPTTPPTTTPPIDTPSPEGTSTSPTRVLGIEETADTRVLGDDLATTGSGARDLVLIALLAIILGGATTLVARRTGA